MDSYLLANADSVVARAKAGDEAALEELYRAFEAPVYNLARRICRTTEDAEDVLQETFFEVCRSIGRYREEGSLWGWVRTIASSKALMRLRRNKYRETDELQEEVMGQRREDTALRMDLEAALERLSGDRPRGRLAARCRGLHPRGDRGDDGEDPELLEVPARPGAPAAPALARGGGGGMTHLTMEALLSLREAGRRAGRRHGPRASGILPGLPDRARPAAPAGGAAQGTARAPPHP